MKKIISLILVFTFIFAFSACGEKTETSDKNNKSEDSSVSVNLKTDVTEVSPGDTVKFTVSIKNSLKFASADFIVNLPEGFTLKENKTVPVPDLQTEIGADEEKVKIASFTMKTLELTDTDIAEFTCVAGEELKSGDMIEFTPEIIRFDEGVDKEGNETVSINDSVKVNGITITVK